MSDRGILPISNIRGIDGISPTIKEKINTTDDYRLTLTDINGSFDTPNLKAGMADIANELRGSISELDTTRPSNNLAYDSHFMSWEEGTSKTITQVSGQYASTLCKVRCSTSALGTVCSKPATGTGMTITIGGTASGLTSDFFALRECVDSAMSNSLIGKTATFSWSIDGVVSSRTFTWSATSPTVAGGGNEVYISGVTAGQVINFNWYKPEEGSKATPCYPRTQAEVDDNVKYFYEKLITDGVMPHGLNESGSNQGSIYCMTFRRKAKTPTASGTFNLLKNVGFAEHASSPIGVATVALTTNYLVVAYIVPFDLTNGYHIKSTGTVIIDART